MSYDILKIPNTEEGKQFWQQFQQFANHDSFHFRRRGRGCRELAGNKYGIPVNFSEKWAIYITIKGERTLTIPDLIEDRRRVRAMQSNLSIEKAITDSALGEQQRWRGLYDQLSDEMDKREEDFNIAMAAYKNTAQDTIGRYANERSRYRELARKVIVEKGEIKQLARKEYNRLLFLTAVLSGFLAVTLFLLIH
jgi:hypothetical protein